MNKEDGLFTYEEVSRLAKRLEEETIDTRQELTKYKRAFEILIKYNEVFDDERDDEIIYYLDGGFEPHRISQEEYELLEELMKGE